MQGDGSGWKSKKDSSPKGFRKGSSRKKGSLRSRFSLQQILYSPLLNPQRRRLLQGKQEPSHPPPTFEEHASSKKRPSRDVEWENRSDRESSDRTCTLSPADVHPVYLDADKKRPRLMECPPRLLECPLCLGLVSMDAFYSLTTCGHMACNLCIRTYLTIEISEARILLCFECPELIHPNDVQRAVKDDILISKYEEFMLRRVLALDPDTRWCPAPDCTFAVIAAGCASCPKLHCERPGCNTSFCYHCKAYWHPNQTCDSARAARSPNFRTSSTFSFSYDPSVLRELVKACPRCQALIMKQDDGSCNHMTCSVCGTEFCWLCMKEISDLHYLSPSGCTFWGKKPWSRKKKILWQIGTLIGAPIGIALVAGIAVPAMVIGIPVWVGRKIYQKYRHSNKHKRNLAIFGGVSWAVVISPLMAGLAVGIGVPILLAYVYGVVPVSLCRAGMCGVSTSPSGVKLDFDEEDPSDVLGTFGSRAHDTQSVDTGHRVGNPSIGEASIGLSLSLSMGDASSMQTADRESASVTALGGSIASSALHNRLEVQADVSTTYEPHKRSSVSSESVSAIGSVSDRHSAIVSVPEDRASNVALAGSVLSYKLVNETTSRTPVDSLSMRSEETSFSTNMRLDSMSVRSGDTVPHPPSLSPVSSFSGDEILVSCGRRSTRRRIHIHRQLSESAGSMGSGEGEGEDGVSERVRFDDNVSFIDDHPVMEEEQEYQLADPALHTVYISNISAPQTVKLYVPFLSEPSSPVAEANELKTSYSCSDLQQSSN